MRLARRSLLPLPLISPSFLPNRNLFCGCVQAIKTLLIKEAELGGRAARHAENKLLAIFKSLAHFKIFEGVAVWNFFAAAVISVAGVYDNGKAGVARERGRFP